MAACAECRVVCVPLVIENRRTLHPRRQHERDRRHRDHQQDTQDVHEDERREAAEHHARRHFGLVSDIFITLNPDKLARLEPVNLH
jgi:hypothetical protein